MKSIEAKRDKIAANIAAYDQELKDLQAKITDLQTQIDAKQAEIDAKQLEIDNKQKEIDATQAQVDALKEKVKKKNGECAVNHACIEIYRYFDGCFYI